MRYGDICPRFDVDLVPRHESIEPAEPADSIDPMLANEPTENADRADPIDPTERTDPIDPIESTELREPMHRIEFSELIDQREVLMTQSLHPPSSLCVPTVEVSGSSRIGSSIGRVDP